MAIAERARDDQAVFREQTLSLHGVCGTRLEPTFAGLFCAPAPYVR